MGWTPEQKEELTRLWNEGLSTGEIGKALGMSKNAVVGQAHRLGLERRPSPIRRVGEDGELPLEPAAPVKPEPALAPAPKPKAAPKAKPSAKKASAPKEKYITVNDLTTTTCRWPVGDPKDPDFHFCGKEVISGKPYCLEHCEEAYVMTKNVR